MSDTYTICAVDLPMPPDTLITVGMPADVEGHGDRIPIKVISIALCPHRDPAAEGGDEYLSGFVGPHPTAIEVGQVEAALLPYAVFDLGSGGWCHGRQIRRVYEAGE